MPEMISFFRGISASCSAAANDFSGMMCVRFAIGMAEAGFFPSVLYHMAFWYKPSELPQRIAIFYSLGQLSSALSGLLAYAISFMVGEVSRCSNGHWRRCLHSVLTRTLIAGRTVWSSWLAVALSLGRTASDHAGFRRPVGCTGLSGDC